VQGLRARARWAALIGWIFYSYKLKYSTVERGCLRPTDLEGLGRVGARLSLAMIHKEPPFFVRLFAGVLTGFAADATAHRAVRQIPVAFDGSLSAHHARFGTSYAAVCELCQAGHDARHQLAAGSAEAEAHASLRQNPDIPAVEFIERLHDVLSAA